MLNDLKSVDDVVVVAKRILENLAQPFVLDGDEITITTTLGIAVYPEDGTGVDGLLQRAEMAMTCTKRPGGNRFQFFAEEMNVAVAKKLAMEKKLRKAIARQELILHYQPLWKTQNRQPVGVEALLRWKQEDSRLVAPNDFIPLAEETGLIVPIGEWVLRTACQQIGKWHKEGFPSLRLSVNLAHRQLLESNFVSMVAKILSTADFDPALLELEVTESSLIDDEPDVLDALHALRAMGIRLAIDDFGTGHSSISYLRRLPLTTLKIDRSFISGIGNGNKDVALTKALITLAHNLGLRTVAEGVETEQQMAFLSENQCDEVQGFLLSRPVPAERTSLVLEQARKGLPPFQASAQPS